jgi:CRISPR-associated endonuclease/helicase Cas3
MHSVPHHSLDVAASATVLLETVRLPVAVPKTALVALIACHDIGKFTRPFQAKARELWPSAMLGEFPGELPGYHDDHGYAMLCGKLGRRLDRLFDGWPPSARRDLFRAVTGHHGRPPQSPTEREPPRAVACDVCRDAAGNFIAAALAAINPLPLPQLSQAERQRLAWFVAGLAVAADWLGSNRRWFSFVIAAEHTNLERYWHEVALRLARTAAAAAGLLPSQVAPATGLSLIFPEISVVRPAQSWAETVPLPDRPALFTIEDVTGSGKTEAALVLAHRLMAAGRGDGLFFALPTMATADAMYARLGEAYRRLFLSGEVPSLVLSHGRRSDHAGFTSSILDGAAKPNGNARDPADQTAGAQCAAWIADDSRKAFLAEIGVGTIDQALLGVLPTRHAPLRLFGLSRKILIVDEAHAYDAYMSEELQRLLTFQAALGGSAIVLSATLTAQQRHELNSAFLAGLGRTASPDGATGYPLVTIASAAGITAERRDIAPDLIRSVAVERISDRASAVVEIVLAADAGAAVVWVRNAVDDAIEAHALLRAAGVNAMLFHARFAMGDRQNIERKIVARFGRKSRPKQRRGRVLVATQVVEQSLDLDFDLLVSDLAPADLVIQRAGRLWRHKRCKRPIAGPRLLLLTPEPIADPPANWPGLALLRTGYVYPDHALLWRSANILLETGVIETPNGIRRLVEYAYDDTAADAVPAGLAASARRAERGDLTAAGIAGQNLLELDPPYQREAALWESDIRTPTRLAEARVVFRLARIEDGTVVPWFRHEDEHRAWALSEVSVPAYRLAAAVENALVATLKQGWPAWDRDTPVLVLAPGADGRMRGMGLDREGGPHVVTYDPGSGLRIL